MKRYGSILLVLCALLIFSGCGSGKEDIELPQTLQITAELPTDYPSEVTAYNLTWYEMDEQTAVDAFMHDDSPERVLDDTNSGIGPQYRGVFGDGEEVMNLYSGVVHGGMDYRYHSLGYANIDKKREILDHYLRRHQPWECIKTDNYPRMMGNGSMGEAGQEDLDFKPYDDALEEIESKISACGFPEHELIRGEAHTAGLLNQNRDIYNRFAKERGGEVISETFTKDDEYYYFEFREILDNIPFCNGIWAETTFGVSGGGSLPSIQATYDKDGLIYFYATDMMEVGEAVSTEPIIPPEEALKVYVDEYSKAIHFENTEILSVELNYVVIADSKGLYARPVWAITTATEVKAGSFEGQDFDYIENAITAVSAYSGVILERETDMR